MFTICKEIRRLAVCGDRPGGANAYTLKESCIAKVKNPAAVNNLPKKSTLLDSHKRLESFLEFSKSELTKLIVRETQLRKMKTPPPVVKPVPGSDHHVVKRYILDAKKHPNDSVRKRIKLACEYLNSKRRPEKHVVFNYAMEQLVIMGAINYYTGVMIELNPNIKLVKKAKYQRNIGGGCVRGVPPKI